VSPAIEKKSVFRVSRQTVSAASASLRVVVLNPTAAPVNVSVAGSMVSSSLPYLGDADYVKAAGAGRLDIETSNPVAVNPVNFSPNLATNSKNTFLLRCYRVR
jgi:hypothetical protein